MKWKIAILSCLFLGFYLLFERFRRLRLLENALRYTKRKMDARSRQRRLSDRKRLKELEKKNSIWYWLERQLYFCGIKRRVPWITAEIWLAGTLLAEAIVIVVAFSLGASLGKALLGAAVLGLAEWGWMMLGRNKAIRQVDQDLLKFLDFLGNYSITAGELTKVLGQVGRYMEEPLKSVLAECSVEIQTTGDAGLALVAMSEKIEHPQFVELVRNLEVTLRYCADFTSLVHNSRKSAREYLRAGGERRAMLREALINMLLLLGLSVFVVLTVDRLLEKSVWSILFHTLPGKLALTVLGVIFWMFAGQLYKANK